MDVIYFSGSPADMMATFSMAVDVLDKKLGT
jgi:hypothetical protein